VHDVRIAPENGARKFFRSEIFSCHGEKKKFFLPSEKVFHSRAKVRSHFQDERATGRVGKCVVSIDEDYKQKQTEICVEKMWEIF
jgi:hypothetical protein